MPQKSAQYPLNGREARYREMAQAAKRTAAAAQNEHISQVYESLAEGWERLADQEAAESES